MDVKKGFSKMRMTFDVDVNLRAIKINKCAQVVPTTLAMTYGNCSRLIPSKKDVLIASPFLKKT